VELRTALVGLPRQVVRLRVIVERFRDNHRQPIRRVLRIRFTHASSAAK
jgi:hypothetical protein